MIPPPLDSKQLVIETLGLLVAIALSAWALWVVFG